MEGRTSRVVDSLTFPSDVGIKVILVSRAMVTPFAQKLNLTFRRNRFLFFVKHATGKKKIRDSGNVTNSNLSTKQLELPPPFRFQASYAIRLH